jgi:hypothetical protein
MRKRLAGIKTSHEKFVKRQCARSAAARLGGNTHPSPRALQWNMNNDPSRIRARGTAGA